jgi:hypothetical protein
MPGQCGKISEQIEKWKNAVRLQKTDHVTTYKDI